MPFPRDYIDVPGLPDGWRCARFPTIMSGEVLRYYCNEVERVNASRDGVGVRGGPLYESAASLDDLRRMLALAEREADRLSDGDRGRWGRQ